MLMDLIGAKEEHNCWELTAWDSSILGCLLGIAPSEVSVGWGLDILSTNASQGDS